MEAMETAMNEVVRDEVGLAGSIKVILCALSVVVYTTELLL
jgi:hypothetical protein